MPTQANEAAFEQLIVQKLSGHEADQAGHAMEPPAPYGAHQGYWKGNPRDFDAQYAVDQRMLFDFLHETQPDALEEIKSTGSDWPMQILQRLDRKLKQSGILEVLRKGLRINSTSFRLYFDYPPPHSSEEAQRGFRQNRFSVTRQVRYHQDRRGEEIDLVVFVNGLPLITMELKYAQKGQNARYHGCGQYRKKRDPKQPLLQYARCVVHMAVDADEIFMTTRLDGDRTFFLPFNRGHQFGSGNPPNDYGYKTAYLWEEVLARPNLARLLQHYVTLEHKKTNDPLSKRKLIFPRYHQWDVVRRILDDAARKGVGQRYLVQHSAGSGKSNSITWAALQLIEVYPVDAQVHGAKAIDRPLFDSVLVVTDRRLLERQIRNTITAFAQVKNIVAATKNAQELKQAIAGGKKIIITTLQRFPWIVEEMGNMEDRNFAILIDEAHSSQSGTAHDSMNQAVGAYTEEGKNVDTEEKIASMMEARKRLKNASYLAFTATPKPITLEKFGVKQPDGTFKPFHLYSMRQAIEEGFILDVIRHYTTHRSYYEIQKSIQDNPLFNSAKAQKKLKAYVESQKMPIRQKAEVMLDHFTRNVYANNKLKGQGKGMVVTQNIASAIQYYFAIQDKIRDENLSFKVLIAFSGEGKITNDQQQVEQYTEEDLNHFPSGEIKDRFDEDEYRLLVVANKFLTGFDQPKLCAMYVDKRLQGVQAVQTLSRLNRTAPWLNKRTEDLFVLDFFNNIGDIQAAFQDFYTATHLSEATDVNVLHDLKDAMDQVGVYEWDEVEQFNRDFFNKQSAEVLEKLIDGPADRFKHQLALEDEEQADFKIKAKQFVKIYGQMASIIHFSNRQWEKLFWFLKFLIPKLPVKDQEMARLDDLLEKVDLSTYGLERTQLDYAIDLEDQEAEVDPQNPNLRGAYGEPPELDPLEQIVEEFNDRNFSGWHASPEEKRVKLVSLANRIKQNPGYQSQVAQNTDPQTRKLALAKMLGTALREQRQQDLELYKQFSNDPSFKESFINAVSRVIG